MSDWIVLKFGGTSVSSRQAWETIAEILRARREEFPDTRLLVVCSAVSKVSDQLEALLESALEDRHRPILDWLRQRHRELAESLEVSFGTVELEFDELERVATGVSLIRELTPRLKARVMSRGEFLSTRLGTEFLRERCGLPVAWHDVRELLQAEPSEGGMARRYLAASCNFEADPSLEGRLGDMPVIVTQGFVARDAEGNTVLLGRGGSDTSGAYLAARVQARRLEIWTDVAGMYTADPRHVPTARLLKQLDYAEAQELASSGAKVLHPRCLPPVARYGIPLHIYCTGAPKMEGTVIQRAESDVGRVKAISTKSKVTLIGVESQRMWQQVGFLAELFESFSRHGLSVDLVATSETNVTVSLDGSVPLDPGTVDRLAAELAGQGDSVRITPGCSSISLIGNRIRSQLHRLGPVLELFEEEPIHLMTQASSDLNLTFVVDEEQAGRLVSSLHAALFSAFEDDPLFGPAWQAPRHEGEPWWKRRRSDLMALADQAPLYVYDRGTLLEMTRRLLELEAIDCLFFAMKANNNVEVLRLFHELKLGFECVSPGELAHVHALFGPVPRERLLYTPNFASSDDYEAGFMAGATVTLDNLHPLLLWPDLFRGKELFLRLDPGKGGGHHKHVRTAGYASKFGISRANVEKVHELVQKLDIRVTGLHSHRGSGIQDPEMWQDTAVYLASVAEQLFPDVHVLDLGGGLGVPERSTGAPLDLTVLDDRLSKFKSAHPRFKLWLEPGRYLVASAGVLLARVTQLKEKLGKHFVGVETGMNSLIRPALYGSYHEIVNLSRLGDPLEITADVVGPICESGDVLGHGRRLPRTHPGDLMLIATAGAYGRVMSSQYNLRPPAEERLLA